MRTRHGVAALIVLAAAAGCAQPAAVQRLESVAKLPAPSSPSWISQIAPVGTAQPRSQIRVIFTQPVLPVEQLGSQNEQNVLGHFSIAPAVPGHFVVLTPKMIGFQADAPIPGSTRIRVTLSAGLRDLQGHTLANDLAWTFETPAITLTTPQPDGSASPAPLKPAIRVVADGRVDEASLREHATFRAGDSFIGVNVARESPAPDAQTLTYDLTPERDLSPATRYDFTLDQGVMPDKGNIASASSLKFAVTTYSPLAFAGARAAADPMAASQTARFGGGDPVLAFNNALEPDTFAQHVHIQPAPGPVGKTFALSGDAASVLVNPYALAPRTSYAFTIDAGLRDAFGQTLGHDVRGSFKTGDLSPYFWAPNGFSGFASSQNLQLDYTALNVPGNVYSAAYRVLSPEDVLQTDTSGSNDLTGGHPNRFAIPGAALNRQVTVHVPLRRQLGGPSGVLAYTASANTGAAAFSGVVELTNLGVFAQWFPASGVVMVQHLSDGSPVANASVDVYRSNVFGNAAVATDACAHGTTGGAGTLTISGDDIQRCYAGNRPADEAPELFVVARSGADWTFVRTFSWGGIYTYANNVNDATWSSGQPISRGTIFSDRQMYQPGERGWFTAVCYVLQNGVLHADRNASYRLVLRDPNGAARTLPSHTTNGYATFSFPIDFTKAQALGYYTIEATSPAGAQITGNFRVAEFHPPNFAVDLTLDKQFAAAGEAVDAKGSAKYLFGAPMTGSGTLHVTREQTTFSPKGWDDYWFGRQWFWPEQSPSADSDAGTQSVQFDAKGDAATQITVARDLPYPMTYQVDLEKTDVSNLSSSATQSFTALPSALSIGIKSDFVGTVDTPIAASVIVTDAKGVAQPGVHVHLELQKMKYSSVTQVVEGSEAGRDQVQYVTVAQTDVTSASTPQKASLQTKDAGSFRIRASFSGQSDQPTDTDSMVWVTGPGEAQWAQQNASQLQLQLDKHTYSQGDDASLAVASPYDRADLYVSVVRDRVLWQTVVHVNGSAPRVRIPVTAAMFPNAAVQAVLVRRGAPLTAANARGLDSLVRIGMVPLALDLRPQYLRVSIAPAQTSVQPRARQTIKLHVSSLQGQPARAQFTVIVADDAILRLSGYRPPDLVQIVLQSQPISTRFGDSRPDITLVAPSNTMQKGWGYGGGFLAGAAGTTVRTKFVPLAYFNGSVQSDALGNASVSFEVPDNLTTWRVMAVALGGDVRPRFGSSDGTFVATKPLVTQPLLPQFARPGDAFQGGLTLMNSSNGTVDAATQGSVTGALAFTEPPGSSVHAQQQFAPGLGAWRFGLNVRSEGAASLAFTTTAQSVGSDAFRVPFTVRTADVSESVFDGGLTSTTATMTLMTIASNDGRAAVTLAGSPVAQALRAAQRITGEDPGSLLPDAASRARIGAAILTMQHAAGKTALPVDGARIAGEGIAGLVRLQLPSGGFGFWPGAAGASAFQSADAYGALGAAARSGATVSPHVLERAKAYVVRALADPATADKSCTDSQCKERLRLALLSALAENGDHRTDFVAQLFAARADFSLTDRTQLALLLMQAPGFEAQASRLAGEIDKSVHVGGRYRVMQSAGEVPALLQGAYVQLLVAQRAPQADQTAAVSALVAQNGTCPWFGDFDTAAALQALATFIQAHGQTPNFTANVSVDGKTVGSARFASLTDAPKTIGIPALSRGGHRIAVAKTGTGTLDYLLAYDYHLTAKAPGRLAGLRVRRSVRALGAPAVIASYDLAPTQPLTVAAGNVYDIGVEIITDHPVDNVRVTDPLPAGFEALDTSFLTTAAYYQPLASDWQLDYQKTYFDRIEAFAQHLDAGVYTFHYLVRSVTPGTYVWPGTNAVLMNAPEQFGRSAFGEVRVTI